MEVAPGLEIDMSFEVSRCAAGVVQEMLNKAARIMQAAVFIDADDEVLTELSLLSDII